MPGAFFIIKKQSAQWATFGKNKRRVPPYEPCSRNIDPSGSAVKGTHNLKAFFFFSKKYKKKATTRKKKEKNIGEEKEGENINL